jgi:hypothetical protein
MNRDNLEHGWVGTEDNYFAEEIGYCECCEKTLYSDDYYSIIDGCYYCEDCAEKIRGENYD